MSLNAIQTAGAKEIHVNNFVGQVEQTAITFKVSTVCDGNAQQCAAAMNLIKMGAGDAGLDTAAFTAALATAKSIDDLVMQTTEPANPVISRRTPLILTSVYAFTKFIANKFPASIELSGIVANLEVLIGTADAIAALDDYQSLGPDAAERTHLEGPAGRVHQQSHISEKSC